jgi:hypothetical protein
MRPTPYGVKPYLKAILARNTRKGWVQLYVPINKEWDNHEEEQ